MNLKLGIIGGSGLYEFEDLKNKKTTAAILTVDGGNIEASFR